MNCLEKLKRQYLLYLLESGIGIFGIINGVEELCCLSKTTSIADKSLIINESIYTETCKFLNELFKKNLISLVINENYLTPQQKEKIGHLQLFGSSALSFIKYSWDAVGYSWYEMLSDRGMWSISIHLTKEGRKLAKNYLKKKTRVAKNFLRQQTRGLLLLETITPYVVTEFQTSDKEEIFYEARTIIELLINNELLLLGIKDDDKFKKITNQCEGFNLLTEALKAKIMMASQQDSNNLFLKKTPKANKLATLNKKFNIEWRYFLDNSMTISY